MLLGKRSKSTVNNSSNINESEPSKNHKDNSERMTGNPVKKTSVAFHGRPSSHNHFRIGLCGAPTAEVVAEMPHFLTTCGRYKYRLLPGHDIYMYRGVREFCSSECRDLHIRHDEKEEKRALKEKKGGNH